MKKYKLTNRINKLLETRNLDKKQQDLLQYLVDQRIIHGVNVRQLTVRGLMLHFSNPEQVKHLIRRKIYRRI